jgi:hypothetical protein
MNMVNNTEKSIFVHIDAASSNFCTCTNGNKYFIQGFYLVTFRPMLAALKY